MTLATNMTSTELCNKLKKEAFSTLDKAKKGTTVRVNTNELIDLCLEFENHVDKNYSDLEYCLDMASKENLKLLYILDKISDHVPADSIAWDLSFSQYKSYEEIDNVILRGIKNETD